MKRTLIATLVLALTLGIVGTAEAGNREHRARRKSHVHKVVHRTVNMPLARLGSNCDAKKVIAKAQNNHGDYIFSYWRSVYWCWDRRGNTIDRETINRGAWLNNAWWNLWKFDAVTGNVNTRRVNADGVRYHYARVNARFEACWSFCFMDFGLYVTQTVRANGTYDDGYGPKGDTL